MKKNEKFTSLQQLHELMQANNTNRVIVRIHWRNKQNDKRKASFKLDTGQNIGEFIQSILGHKFDGFTNLLHGGGMDIPWLVLRELNEEFASDFGYSGETINEQYIWDRKKR